MGGVRLQVNCTPIGNKYLALNKKDPQEGGSKFKFIYLLALHPNFGKVLDQNAYRREVKLLPSLLRLL